MVEGGGAGGGLGVAGVGVRVTEGVDSLERGRGGGCLGVGWEEDENKSDETHLTCEIGSRHFFCFWERKSLTRCIIGVC